MIRLREASAFFLAVGLATAAQATTETYNGFGNTSGLTLVGNAATTTTSDGTVLRLTQANGSQAGAAYSTSPISLGSNDTFSTQFQFRFTNPGGVDPADGITFVLAESTSGLGNGGYGMGYAGPNLNNSIAIEFDTYNNHEGLGYFPTEPDSSNHVAVDTDGNLTNTFATNVYGNGSCGFSGGNPVQNPNTASGCMSNGELWTADISYDGSTQLLNVALTDPSEGSTFHAITNQTFDIGSYLGGASSAYVGFTAGTGAGYENHDIVNWEFADTATLPTPTPSVPEPSGLALFAGALACLALLRKRKGHPAR